MRAEKQIISTEYIARLNSSPFFIVVDYTGLKVGPMTELRKRLLKAGAEIHVVKNTIFRIAAKEAGVPDLAGSLAGQLAVVTGQITRHGSTITNWRHSEDFVLFHFPAEPPVPFEVEDA